MDRPARKRLCSKTGAKAVLRTSDAAFSVASILLTVVPAAKRCQAHVARRVASICACKLEDPALLSAVHVYNGTTKLMRTLTFDELGLSLEGKCLGRAVPILDLCAGKGDGPCTGPAYRR